MRGGSFNKPVFGDQFSPCRGSGIGQLRPQFAQGNFQQLDAPLPLRPRS
jgi:hypothetical protein